MYFLNQACDIFITCSAGLMIFYFTGKINLKKKSKSVSAGFILFIYASIYQQMNINLLHVGDKIPEQNNQD